MSRYGGIAERAATIVLIAGGGLIVAGWATHRSTVEGIGVGAYGISAITLGDPPVSQAEGMAGPPASV